MSDINNNITVPTNDHDSLVTLVETVKNLKDSQDKFHQDIKDSIGELKDNYATRLNIVEAELRNADKVYQAKADQDEINKNLAARMSTQENWRWYITGAIAIVAFALVIYATLHK